MDHHFSDEILLSHLDGELPGRLKKKVRQHLEVCWQCRTRQKGLEDAIQAVSKADSRLIPSPYWHVETRDKLAALQRSLGQEREPVRPPSISGGWKLAAACVLFAVVAFAVSRLLTPRPAPPVASSMAIARASLMEAALAGQSVHQVFSVEQVHVQPKGPKRTGRIEVWSEGHGGRFASRWVDSSGVLRHAMWRPGTDSDYLYSSATSNGLAARSAIDSEEPVLPEVSGAELDLDHLEASLMRWLERRKWKPIAFLPSLSLWASRGLVLSVERIADSTLRLTGKEKRNGVAVYFVALVDEGEFWPYLQTIGFETADRKMEIQLASRRTERVARFTPAVFEPDRSVAFTKVARREAARSSPAIPLEKPELQPATPPPNGNADLVARQIEAYYLLHRAGAFREGSVRISQDSTGVYVSPQTAGSAQAHFATVALLSDLTAALADLRHLDTPPPALPANPEARKLHRHAAILAALARTFNSARLRGIPPSYVRLLDEIIRDQTEGLKKCLQSPAGAVENPGWIPAKDWWSSAALLLAETAAFLTAEQPDSALLQRRLEEFADLHRRQSELGRSTAERRLRE